MANLNALTTFCLRERPSLDNIIIKDANLGKWPQGCLALLDNAINVAHFYSLHRHTKIFVDVPGRGG